MPESSDSQPLQAQAFQQLPQKSWIDGNVEKIVSWVFQVLIGIVAFLAISQFNGVQSDLKELRNSVEELRREQARVQGEDLKHDIEVMRKDLRDIELYIWRGRGSRGSSWLPESKPEDKQPR